MIETRLIVTCLVEQERMALQRRARGPKSVGIQPPVSAL
jgi:hypothetical protein